MAESKYLDRGGLEYLWSKVKSYISSYLKTSNISDLSSFLTTWKQINIGNGSYFVDGKFILEHDSELSVIDESIIDIRGARINLFSGTSISSNSNIVLMYSPCGFSFGSLNGGQTVSVQNETNVAIRFAILYYSNNDGLKLKAGMVSANSNATVTNFISTFNAYICFWSS